MALYIPLVAIWQYVSQLLAKPREDTRSACRRHEQPRLIADDLGKTALRLVPVKPRRRPTGKLEPLSPVARFELVRPLKHGHLTAEQLEESNWEPVDFAEFRRLWQAEVGEAAASHKRERLHLATGLLLPVWDKLPSDYVRVSRISARDGRSLLGREVPLHCVPELCQALGLEDEHAFSAEQIVDAVLTGGRPMQVMGREALTLKRSLVNPRAVVGK